MLMPSARPKIFLAGKKNLTSQNFLDLHICIGFGCFWPAKLFLASQNQILASQKNFGRADGIGNGLLHMALHYTGPSTSNDAISLAKATTDC